MSNEEREIRRKLRTFSDAHPAIRLELVVSDAPLDLNRREADLAIRCTDDHPPNLVGGRKHERPICPGRRVAATAKPGARSSFRVQAAAGPSMVSRPGGVGKALGTHVFVAATVPGGNRRVTTGVR